MGSCQGQDPRGRLCRAGALSFLPLPLQLLLGNAGYAVVSQRLSSPFSLPFPTCLFQVEIFFSFLFPWPRVFRLKLLCANAPGSFPEAALIGYLAGGSITWWLWFNSELCARGI